jgi:putative ABC transport system permease protein
MSVSGVALALVLILALDAIFTGAERQITAYIDRSGADVFVAQRGVRNMHMVYSWLPESVVTNVQAVEGVESATPVLYVTGMVDTGKERNLAYVIGLPADARMGTPWRIAQGEGVPQVGEAVIDKGVAERAGLEIGDSVSILGRKLRVVGLSAGTASITNSVAFISIEDFRATRGGTPLVSYVLVKVAQGQEAQSVAARIEEEVGAVTGVTAQTRERFSREERALVKDMAGDVLTIMNLVGLMVGLAVMSLTVYTATLARRAEYGVLKAVGAKSRHLYLAVVAQALYSVALGFALGLAITLAITVVAPLLASNLPMQIGPESLLKVGALSVMMAGISAVLPMTQIARLDPATVFKRKVQ